MVKPLSSGVRESCDPIEEVFYKDTPELRLLTNSDPVVSKPKKPGRPGKKKKIHPEVESYYSRLGKYPPLIKKEEVLIFAKYTRLNKKLKRLVPSSPHISKTKKEILDTKNEIIHRNLRFVVKVASGFWMDGKVDSLENLISAGNIGLIRAIDKFKPNLGNRFLTYAAHWIALEIREEMSSTVMLRLPTWWQKTLRDITKAYAKLAKGDLRFQIDAEEFSMKTGIPVKHINIISGNTKVFRSEHLPTKASSRVHAAILTEEPKGDPEYSPTPFNAPDDVCLQENTTVLLREIMDKLPPKEKMVVEQIYGLNGDDPKNLRQVSNVLGNTSERVRQLRVKGITTIRKKIMAPPELGGLGISKTDDFL